VATYDEHCRREPRAYHWTLDESLGWLPAYSDGGKSFQGPRHTNDPIPFSVQGGAVNGESYYYTRTGQGADNWTWVTGTVGDSSLEFHDTCSTARIQRHYGGFDPSEVEGNCSITWPHGIEDLEYSPVSGRIWSVTEYETDYDSYFAKNLCKGGGDPLSKNEFPGKLAGRHIVSVDLSKLRTEYCE